MREGENKMWRVRNQGLRGKKAHKPRRKIKGTRAKQETEGF